MKKKILCGVVAAAVLTATVFAATPAVMKSIYVQMGGITVTYLGAELDLKDATGATVEPIVYNGTTYLPVRSVAEAAGLEVAWDGATSTVALNGTSITYLDEMPCVLESSTEAGSTFNALGEQYGFDRSLYVESKVTYPANIGVESENTSLYFTLNGDYTTFATTIDCVKDSNFNGSIVKIYGDGKVLYTSTSIVEASPIYDVELDVTGVKELQIEIVSETNGYSGYRNFCFGEARVVK